MTLSEYLSNNTLISNTYDLFNYEYFKTRFNSIYGNRKIRDDKGEMGIAIIAQNVIDINEPFIRNMFSKTLDPFATWGEKGTNSEIGENTHKNTNTLDGSTTTTQNTTNTDSGTVKNTNGGTVSVAVDNTQTPNTTSTTNNSVYAYNSTTAAPHDNSTTTNSGSVKDIGSSTTTNDLNSNETRNLTQETKGEGSATTNQTISDSGTDNHNINGNYEKSGYSLDEYERVKRYYTSVYDYIIGLIAPEILKVVIEW